jgi:N4-gp56 family major capsid protein
MAGQVWQTDALGGYMWSPNLSRKLRTALQPMVRYRQFCDAREAFGVGKGEFFNWNTYSDLVDEGGTLDETEVMPESNYTISQKSLTVSEYGISVPYTKKLDDLSEQPVTEIIHQVLKNDARKVLDKAAHAQFENTLVTLTGTTGPDTVTVQVNGTFSGAAVVLNNEHVKLIADIMAEREIPSFDGNNYMAVSRPTALRGFKNDLESIHQYTTEGWHVIMNGEKGRYEGIRFVEQTNIATKGYAASGADQIFFFGADTVVEAFSIPEEVRGKIPTDYGRSRGVAWYALLGYGIVHTADAQTRILEWGGSS